jgi:hypothetical protein
VQEDAQLLSERNRQTAHAEVSKDDAPGNSLNNGELVEEFGVNNSSSAVENDPLN